MAKQKPYFHLFEEIMAVCTQFLGKQQIDEWELMAQQKQISYSDLLKMLAYIESQMIEKVEFYNEAKREAMGGDMKQKMRWTDTLKKAEEELKYRKYLEAKAREAEQVAQKQAKNLEKIQKNALVKPDFGKKKMIRSTVEVKVVDKSKKKQEVQDPDLAMYFGNYINLDDIPDPSAKESIREDTEEEVDPYEF